MSFEEDCVNLRGYDPATMMRPDTSCLVVGQTGSGKTCIMMYLLMCMARQLDVCCAFVGTTDTLEEYKEHLPSCMVYNGFKLEHLERITEAQKKLQKRKPLRTHDGTLKMQPLRRVGIVMDDLGFDKNAFANPVMGYMMKNGRHENFFFLKGIQYALDFPKNLRGQFDLVITFPEANIMYRDPLRLNFLGCFSSDEQLVRVFDHGLQNHEALVFDQRAHRNKKPSLFYLKVPDSWVQWVAEKGKMDVVIPRFRVGSDMFWLMYYKYFIRANYQAVEDDIDASLKNAKGFVTTETEAQPASKVHMVRGRKVLPVHRQTERAREERGQFPPPPQQPLQQPHQPQQYHNNARPGQARAKRGGALVLPAAPLPPPPPPLPPPPLPQK